jgi:hypothetical protein
MSDKNISQQVFSGILRAAFVLGGSIVVIVGVFLIVTGKI